MRRLSTSAPGCSPTKSEPRARLLASVPPEVRSTSRASKPVSAATASRAKPRPRPEPAPAPSGRALWERATGRHDEVLSEYAAYELDPDALRLVALDHRSEVSLRPTLAQDTGAAWDERNAVLVVLGVSILVAAVLTLVLRKLLASSTRAISATRSRGCEGSMGR